MPFSASSLRKPKLTPDTEKSDAVASSIPLGTPLNSMKKSSLPLLKFLAVLALSGTATSAQAAVMAYDGFSSTDYTPGQILNQNPTISGFTGAWTGSTNIYAGNSTAALSYTGVASDNTGGTFSNSVGGRSGRVMSTTLGGNGASGTSVYYISLMMQNSVVNVANYRAFELESQFNNRNFQLGAAADTGSTNWGMRVTTATSSSLTANSTVASVAGQTVFAIVKLTYSDVASGDSAQLWINPTDLRSEALSTNSVSLTGFDFLHNSAKNIQLASFSGTGTSYWDEIRVGTSWADVTPVPEPSTWLLLGLGLTTVIVFRRRTS
jgi:hypothetical protein